MNRDELLQILQEETDGFTEQSRLRDDVLDALEKVQELAINYTRCCKSDSEQLPTKNYEIDFGGDVLAGIEITNNEPKIIGAMNGWGNGISTDKITITEK